MSSNSYQSQNLGSIFGRFRLRRGLIFGLIIVTALFAFEIFNFSTTDFALQDLLGGLSFAGISWATILAIAFCGIDFAGIARLFTPEEGTDEPGEVWYLFGAWLLAATMNAMLTWWGVSLAILNHQTLGNTVIDRSTLLRVVPIFVAVMVWLIRVLIIGTFSVAGDRLFSQSDRRFHTAQRGFSTSASAPLAVRSLNNTPLPRPSGVTSNAFRPSPKVTSQTEASFSRPEPTYHPVTASASPANSGSTHNTVSTASFSGKTGSQVRR